MTQLSIALRIPHPAAFRLWLVLVEFDDHPFFIFVLNQQ